MIRFDRSDATSVWFYIRVLSLLVINIGWPSWGFGVLKLNVGPKCSFYELLKSQCLMSPYIPNLISTRFNPTQGQLSFIFDLIGLLQFQAFPHASTYMDNIWGLLLSYMKLNGNDLSVCSKLYYQSIDIDTDLCFELRTFIDKEYWLIRLKYMVLM